MTRVLPDKEALPLAAGARAGADEAGGDDAGVVEDEEVTGRKEARQVGEGVVADLARRAAQHQQARGVAARGGLLGDQLLGQVVIEGIEAHYPV